MRNLEKRIDIEIDKIFDFLNALQPISNDYEPLLNSAERLVWMKKAITDTPTATVLSSDGDSVAEEPVKPTKKSRKSTKVIDIPIAEEPVKEEPVKEEPVKEEPVKEEPVKEEPIAEEPKFTFAEVKEYAANVSANGKRAEVKALIEKYTEGLVDTEGKSLPKKLSSMDPKDYPAFMQEVKNLTEEE